MVVTEAMWPISKTWVRPGCASSLMLAVLACGLVLDTGTVRAASGTNGVKPPRPPSILDATNGVGSWIWDTNAFSKQTCRFWKRFDVPSAVARASLRLTVDNGYRLFLDGQEIGRGSDWRTLTEYDITWLLNPGSHVLAVEAFNDRLEGGLICGLRIDLVDQQVIEVASDSSWWVVTDAKSGWETQKHPGPTWRPAKIVGTVQTPPWNDWPIGRAAVSGLRPVVVRFWQTGWFQIALLGTCGIAVAVCLQLMGRLAVQSKAQKFLHVERARIARDIHDDVGAQLTQLVLLGEVARSELPADSEARAQVDQLCERARNLSHAMDEVVWAVNSRRDTLRDFASYVCKHAQLYLASTPIRCRLDVEPDIPATAFELPARRALFLAVKEALNNAAKHSGATELFLRISRENHRLIVVVEDNGLGFNLERVNWERNGMTNMSQRMSEVGGEFRVSSAPDAGCRIEFVVPLAGTTRLARWFHGRFARPADDCADAAASKEAGGAATTRPAKT